tara:strand:+ start:663 stop:1802 length:1140 start_codon:yes stop_codon:yes gene_type:complete
MDSRVLLLSPDFPPPMVGGSLVYLDTLIQNSDLNFEVFTNKKNRKSTAKIKFKESIFLTDSNNPSSFRLFLMYFFLFFQAFFIKNKIVILNVSVIANGYLSFLLKLLNKNVVILVYGEELSMCLKGKSIKSNIKKLFFKLYFKSDQIISVSDFAKNIVINYLNYNKKIDVIPTPLNSSKSINIKKTRTNKKENILSVGRLVSRKGFLFLIESFRYVVNELPNAKLVIIGSGPELNNIKSKINELNLNKSVKILSDIDDGELKEHYNKSDVFVLANLMLPNGDCEGAPNVIIEAASYGLPCIAGEEGGTSNVIDNEKTGFLLNPMNVRELASKILLTLKDDKKYKEMSIAAYEKVKLFHDQKKAGKKFESLLTALNNNKI